MQGPAPAKRLPRAVRGGSRCRFVIYNEFGHMRVLGRWGALPAGSATLPTPDGKGKAVPSRPGPDPRISDNGR